MGTSSGDQPIESKTAVAGDRRPATGDPGRWSCSISLTRGFCRSLLFLFTIAGCFATVGCQGDATALPLDDQVNAAIASPFGGTKAGQAGSVMDIELCWCPPGKFIMGSPPGEPERRPGENQVEVIFAKGFWMSKYEVTQEQWKRVMGDLPGELTAELIEGPDFPVGNMNFAEAESFWGRTASHDAGNLAGQL